MDAKKEIRSTEMEVLLGKHREAFFDGAMAAINKELSAARVECTPL